MSPYEITFGKKPPSLIQYLEGTSNVEAVDERFKQRDQMLAGLAKKLTKAQQRMKVYVDKQHCDLNFEVGDWVLVRLRPRR